MIFCSLPFYLFFIFFAFAYFVTPHQRRWVTLLLGSWVFYASWSIPFTFLLIATGLINFYLSHLLVTTVAPLRRQKILALGIVYNLLLLFAFKYSNFFIQNFVQVFVDAPLPLLNIILPLGISFHTFQLLGYLFDVYYQRIAPCQNLGHFLLFVSFFPQLIAGPIERSKDLLPQIILPKIFSEAATTSGLQLFFWGLFKKLAIADRLGIYVDTIYQYPHQGYDGIHFLTATFYYAIQLYCDFSGYSDMARGISRILGIELTLNFKNPFLAINIADFWNRWHITLSKWLRDYLYFPLTLSPLMGKIGGNFWYRHRLNGALFLTFVVSGLWHGANWTFLVWGIFHGIFLVVGNQTKRAQKQFYTLFFKSESATLAIAFKRLITFQLVLFTWIFFKAKDLKTAWFIVNHLFAKVPAFFMEAIQAFGKNDLVFFYEKKFFHTGLAPAEILIALTCFLLVLMAEYLQEFHPHWKKWWEQAPAWMGLGKKAVTAVALVLIFLLSYSSKSGFIYYQF
jgi:alginate O-acetyltransferase complex protein AlgI